ncbi:hypothetical protein CSUB01_12139 [Colletotrichum sublineola]|uniref:Uncharacterized protein n=1 Tax=Colletotrichum sublineola TaxID=1173701 RepID=A0A066X9E0_COLSU|nr:hypothetical protein CSUB01_12139 [Colletotrichum sublineola]
MEHLYQHSSDLWIDSDPFALRSEGTTVSSGSWSSGVNTPSSGVNSPERGVTSQDAYPDPSNSPSASKAFQGSLRTPERLFRRAVSTDAWYQHQLDCDRKTQALHHALTSSTNLFLRDSIGDTILHTLAGDFGLPNLSAETEGYDILQRLFDIGPDGFGPAVKSCCLSMIDLQNDGYCTADGAPAEPFMHTPLGVAILYNNLACAELLLQHGAGPNIPGEWGQRPLFFAYRNNSKEAVELLTAYGAYL